jgi:hypothetical protein
MQTLQSNDETVPMGHASDPLKSGILLASVDIERFFF